jgi:hypothetical protein
VQVVVISYLLIVQILRPYVRMSESCWQSAACFATHSCFAYAPGDDRMHQFVQIELQMILQAGWILYSSQSDTLDESTNIFLSIILIAITLGLIVVFVIAAGMAIRTMLRVRQAKLRGEVDKDELNSHAWESEQEVCPPVGCSLV